MTLLTGTKLNMVKLEAISPIPIDISRLYAKDAGEIVKRSIKIKYPMGFGLLAYSIDKPGPSIAMCIPH